MRLLPFAIFVFLPAFALADEPKGDTIDLAPVTGKLFIPASAKPASASLDLLVHFHGDLALMRRQFTESGLPGVLLVINHNGLSAAYSKPFADRKLFDATLTAAMAALQKQGAAAKDAKWGKLRISFFSAGYGAVRELLKDDDYFKRIDALLSADSIYAGFTGDAAKRQVDPANMKDFRRFAEAAADGKKVFILTHSSLHTPSYASTVETAGDLIAHLKLERTKIDEKDDPPQFKRTSEAKKGKFHVIGFTGEDGPAHMEHLRRIAWGLKQVAE